MRVVPGSLAVAALAVVAAGVFRAMPVMARQAGASQAAGIARGDCSAISKAAEKIQQVVEGFATPIIDRLREWASKVGDFFSGLWQKFGAPA